MKFSENISPLDSRYSDQVGDLALLFSEKSLLINRIKVEVEYLIFLSRHPQVSLRRFSGKEKDILRNLVRLSDKDLELIKKIEQETNHDVKSVEYLIKEKIKNTLLADVLEYVHFGLTSEDTNSISYGMMTSDVLAKAILPAVSKLYLILGRFAHKHKNIPMLARTHGQPASPTTIGKEFKVFSNRLLGQIDQLKEHKVSVKLNGALGNYNALYLAFPKIDWIKFTEDFVEPFNKGRKIKLKPNIVTTQIEPGDSYAELFDNLKRINVILIDLNQDIWRYISDGWLIQRAAGKEVGSSTMPHKINPINFENSEGNLGLANTLLNYFSSKLPISRLQRDLSDSTVKRNFGVAFGHCLLGYRQLLKGLNNIAVNRGTVKESLDKHPEIIAEAVQTILRREGIALSYEKLKKLTRSKSITKIDINNYIDSLKISNKLKNKLKKIEPKTYIGIAPKITRFKKLN